MVFIQRFKDKVQQNHEQIKNQIREQAVQETFAELFSIRSLTLQELAQALNEADTHNLLEGLTLGDFLPKKKPTTKSSGIDRLNEEDKRAAMQLVVEILTTAGRALTKAEIFALTDNSTIQNKWATIARALQREGLVIDNGQARNKKAYLINTQTTRPNHSVKNDSTNNTNSGLQQHSQHKAQEGVV